MLSSNKFIYFYSGALPIVDYNGKYGIEYSHNLINNTIIQSNTQLGIYDESKIKININFLIVYSIKYRYE